ncbi:MAG: ABC transporter permease [Erythrobacter sp.]|nr:ABC transporter permease [Xanthomonadaceae bacterium]MDP2184911.1 ABC transporter permease [Xanthomonadales bacterium]MDZ4116918.1 ABC transporter permease [Xanthomonadaceae bacterium]MDZ4273121.1 ABC transporter permease [Erythrobacter sp.]
MKALNKKAIGDLWHLRGQGIAIALVIAAGIANLVMAHSTYASLQGTRERFYRDYAMADVWAGCKRAPEALLARIAQIPGVAHAQSRLIALGNLSVPGFHDPVKAQVLSLPATGEPRLNRLYLRAGRLPSAEHPDEAVLSESFASAHGLILGDRIRATLNGRSQWFRVVGVALSPEYVYQIQPGAAFPDFKRFGVLWVGRRALEAALDMDGAFNEVALRLQPGADARAVIAELDLRLRRYGGRGGYDRSDQLSNRFLDSELQQLQTMSRLFPAIFLAVAAFLLNVVFTRLIGTQRDQIAVLKAFGYTRAAIAAHYALIVSLIAMVGAVVGVLGGTVLGHWLAGVYQEFYRFPFLDFRVDAGVVLGGIAVTLLACLLGAGQAVRMAAALPPAEAMRPPAPERYRPTVIERWGMQRHLSQPARMILRQLERRPLRALLSVIGLALAAAVMMIGRFQSNSIDYMIDVQFRQAQHNDLSVDLVEPTSRAALFEMAALPGVLHAEPYRSVPVRLRHGLLQYRTGIQGLLPDADLKTPVDRQLRPIVLPPDGLVMTDYLTQLLDLQIGDEVQVEVLEGRQAHLSIPLTAVVSEYIGVQGYMRLDALNRRLGDGDVMSGALLRVDPAQQEALYRRLEDRPRVAGIGARVIGINNFYDTLAESMLVFAFISTLLGGVINFGVVYNAARVALSERGRELASLRVLGFTQGEVATLLLGELAVLVLASIPLGLAFGYGLSWLFAQGLQTDLYRVPVELARSTYAFAALMMIASSLISAWVVWRRITRLDLIAVLKTRE